MTLSDRAEKEAVSLFEGKSTATSYLERPPKRSFSRGSLSAQFLSNTRLSTLKEPLALPSEQLGIVKKAHTNKKPVATETIIFERLKDIYKNFS